MKIFDKFNRGEVSSFDLREGLNDIGVFPTSEEIDLFIQRYDTNRDRVLRFTEFSAAFTPLDSYYSHLVSRRESNGIRYPYRRDDVFMESTKYEFKELWRTHLRIESMAESIRQRLAKRPGFNVYDAFDACDSNADGKISTAEIQRLIESRGFYVSYKDVQGLVEKFDKDKDGRISLGEVS